MGAAPGVGITYQMLEEAHYLRCQNAGLVIAIVENHGRGETAALVAGLERLPMREIEYRGVTLEEMEVEAVIARRPALAIVDELAPTNVPGSNNDKRFEDVLNLLNAGISVLTAVNTAYEIVAGSRESRRSEAVAQPSSMRLRMP